MAEKKGTERKYPGQLVYGLDIGTRSIVGTVGYMYDKKFHVVAIESKPHETRAMQDGQIHSISAVSESITEVTSRLQIKIGRPLHEVCIAAAGRVLRTVTVHVEQELGESRDVNKEDIYSLELLGAQRAYEKFVEESTLNIKFYCVGYTVQKYYLDKYVMSDLLEHKGTQIGADVIATFLPDEVVDGLYKAVERSGLRVADLTLEPIAAMQVAIPQNFRMLNLALVDVGAGTSDISITRDESIVAYGMIPSAGDEITEVIARHYLTDFDGAEQIKYACDAGKEFTYKDIMGVDRKTSPEEVKEVVKDTVKIITREVSDQIKKLNGGKPVSAIFVVGGGGRIAGFTDSLAEEMGIDPTRVAVRGEDVLKNIDFKDKTLPKDSLLVTPIGICMNFFNQKNNFIFVSLNDVQYKLYDNSKLKILDAAVQAGIANADLFPKRGAEINYTINGNKRVARGEMGEGAVIKLNGDDSFLNASIKAGDAIEVQPSTAGEAAHIRIEELPEFTDYIKLIVNGSELSVPKYAEVNGTLQSGYYDIQDGDEIIMRDYVLLPQLLEFIDLRAEKDTDIMINNVVADDNTKIYENFKIDLLIDDSPLEPQHTIEPEIEETGEAEETKDTDKNESSAATDVRSKENNGVNAGSSTAGGNESTEDKAESKDKAESNDAVDSSDSVTNGTSKDDKSESGKENAPESQKVQSGSESTGTSETPGAPGAAGATSAAGTANAAGVSQAAGTANAAGTTNAAGATSAAGTTNAAGVSQAAGTANAAGTTNATGASKAAEAPKAAEEEKDGTEMQVLVNDALITLKGKNRYIFVDVFDYIDFDLTTPHGKMVVTKKNGMRAEYSEYLKEGDRLDIYWEK
ncbi:MAG: pilus assembly protein PilM [Lachnospiraceae bacterium]|nr:pilus assembly protein PilM [Lachnospiraceae bacterium]